MTSDEVIERLRDWPFMGKAMATAAADHIEELEAKLAFAIGVLKDMRDDRVCYRHEVHFRRRAAVVVKDLTGGKDE